MSERVDYEAVVEAYEARLTTDLRGFRGGAGFLDLWVPDPQPEKSILAMIEAAQTGGLPSVTIVLGKKTAGALTRLTELARPLGEVTTAIEGEGVALTVTFGAGTGEVRSEARARAERARLARDAREARLERAEQPVGRPSEDAYKAAVARLQPTHEGILVEEEGLVLVQGGEVQALVDPTTHVIRRARHRGSMLAGALCASIEDKPILEAAYHGVLRLELALRDRTQPRAVPGIVTPEAAFPPLRPLVVAVRGLLLAYRQQTGYAEVDSRWEPDPSPGWKTLTHGERLQRLQTAMDDVAAQCGLMAGDIRCQRLDKNVRVVVEFSDALAPEGKAQLMMKLEQHLKQNLDPTIHIYQEELRDKNKLRRL